MALKLIHNQAWRDCAQLAITDGSFAETASERAGAINITGGPRHLKWTQSGTGTRIATYINKSGNLGADTLVATRANGFAGHEVRIRTYSAYSGTSADSFTSTNFAETLVGPDGTDWVKEFTAVTSKQALGLYLTDGTGGAFTKTLGAVFFGNSISLQYPASMTIRPLDHRAVHTTHGRTYRVHQQITLQFDELTQAEIQSIEQVYKLTREPVFVYDSDGNWIFRKLAYCLIADFQRLQRFNDNYPIQLDLLVLDSGSTTHT